MTSQYGGAKGSRHDGIIFKHIDSILFIAVVERTYKIRFPDIPDKLKKQQNIHKSIKDYLIMFYYISYTLFNFSSD